MHLLFMPNRRLFMCRYFLLNQLLSTTTYRQLILNLASYGHGAPTVRVMNPQKDIYSSIWRNIAFLQSNLSAPIILGIDPKVSSSSAMLQCNAPNQQITLACMPCWAHLMQHMRCCNDPYMWTLFACMFP